MDGIVAAQAAAAHGISITQMGGLPDASTVHACGATTAATTGGDDSASAATNRWGLPATVFIWVCNVWMSSTDAATTLRSCNGGIKGQAQGMKRPALGPKRSNKKQKIASKKDRLAIAAAGFSSLEQVTGAGAGYC
jgi:hypothetical protein